MTRRSLALPGAALLLMLLAVALPIVSPARPVAAAPQGLDLAMPAGGGLLTLSNGTTGELEQPTTLAGTVDDVTGAVDGALEIAPLSFSFDVTTPIPATVYVDAAFSEVTPGTVTGTVSKVPGEEGLGVVSLDATVEVDLDIDVGRPAYLSGQCTASPVALQMTSTAPYDPATGRVTLADVDFSVPPVPITDSCIEILADGVNDALAGGGHALSLTLSGDLPVPEFGSEATATTLTVTPAGSSGQGDEVTLAAAVAPAAGAAAGTPTGNIEFYDGGTSLGVAPVDEAGAASLVTSTLALGDHQLKAVYRGDSTYAPSESAVVAHVVVARPTVEVDMSAAVLIGGLPRTATVTVTSPGAIDGARLDLELTRINPDNGLPIHFAVLDPSRITVEWLDGETWTPVPLASAGEGTVTGSVAPPGGFALPAGSETPVRLRVTVPAVDLPPATTACGATVATCPGYVELTASLVEVDGEGAVTEELAADAHRFTMLEATRRPTTLAVAGGLARPHTVRPGYSVDILAQIASPQGPARVILPFGSFEVLLDGAPARAGRSLESPDEWGGPFPITTLNGQAIVLLPPDIEPGRHVITVRFFGDQLYAPSEVTTAITVVEPAGGHAFVCRSTGAPAQTNTWGAQVTFDADVPAAAAAGSTVELDVAEASFAMMRPGIINPFASMQNGGTFPVGDGADSRVLSIDFGLGPDGSGTAGAIERQGATAMPASPNPADPSQVDQVLTFHDPTASVAVSGAPGDRVPVVLDEVGFISLNGGLQTPVRCTPVDGPMPLGEVEIAGTTVSVDPEGPLRERTDEVTIDAETFPADAAGTVTFTSDLDGELGTDTVADGAASLDTDELGPGTHQITASFDASDPAVPDTTSEPVTLEVTYSPRSGTEAFVVAARTDFTGAAAEDDVVADAAALADGEPRSAYLTELSRTDEYLTHVVNGMYQDTLGRPGSAEDVAFWVGQLRAGWSVARVGASFYGSQEYVSRVGGTPEAWIEDLYETLLGRTADTAGRDYWVSQIPVLGWGGVAHRFFQTPESGAYRVADLYRFFLGRSPSAADTDFWNPVVRRRGDLTLAVFLAGSAEYASRAEARFPLVD